MASPLNEPSPGGPKTKQERIRDNQRRSRARRQEYLADLERRLSECHNARREADLQRSAFTDLQHENTRLRELLNFAGVSPELVETYIRQNEAPQQSNDASNASLRQLKPKIHIQDLAPSPQSSSTSQSRANDRSLSSQPPSQASASGTIAHGDLHHTVETQPFVLTSPVPKYPPPAIAVPSDNDFDWAFAPSANGDNAIEGQSAQPFYCDTFQVCASGPLQSDESNSILCSVAKDLVDQYHIPPQEMEVVKMRLAVGFSKPTSEGQGCRVSNQVLFQVLSEISSKFG